MGFHCIEGMSRRRGTRGNGTSTGDFSTETNFQTPPSGTLPSPRAISLDDLLMSSEVRAPQKQLFNVSRNYVPTMPPKINTDRWEIPSSTSVNPVE